MLPVVAIVGRPNVGKSTLFNRLVGHRQALVDDRPGVTRDRHYGTAEWLGREVVIVDTGGFEPNPSLLDEGDMFRAVRRSAEAAIEEADLILFVVDRQAGLTPADRMTARILRQQVGQAEDRILLVVNKCDGPSHDQEALEFWELGLDPLVTMSAEHGRGLYELWDEVLPRLPEPPPDDDEDPDEIRVAVIGRPNIGKSTLVNRLVGEERTVVHDMPGTTMDPVDSIVEVGDRRYRLVDTAGVRRRTRIDDELETWATLRAIKTIERCHVSLLMIDATEGITTQDARLGALIADRGRACILLLNKWDLVQKDPDRNVYVLRDEMDLSLPHLYWAPELYISALTGKGCHRIFDLVDEVYQEFDRRITTSDLNKLLEQAVAGHQPPQKHHRPVRLNYMTQARVRPPTFIIWSNSPDAVKKPYRRYLENFLRERCGFHGTPLRLKIRQKRRPGEPKQ